MITGGYQDSQDRTALSSAEVVLPTLNKSCILPEMTSARYRHSLTGRLACGGVGEEETSTSCEELGEGEWSLEVELGPRGRLGHTGWRVNGTVLLMGDLTDQDSHANTTELVMGNSSQRLFQLKMKVSLSCGVDDVENSLMILTGGLQQDRKVQIYRPDGDSTGLSDLNTGRHSHGCAGYYKERFGVKSLVVVVAGGLNRFNKSLVSTELFEFDAGHYWNYVSPLPSPLSGLRGSTLRNTILMTGGYNNKSPAAKRDILRYDAEKDRWELVQDMRSGRAEHAVSTVRIPDGFTDGLDCSSSLPRGEAETEAGAGSEEVGVGILITGGYTRTETELFLPWTGSQCSLRNIRSPRVEHTQSGLTLCGGARYSKVKDTCDVWRNGNWEELLVLQHRRYSHVAWTLPDSILLLGGGGGEKVNMNETDCLGNAEMVRGNSSEISFPLKYNLK